MSDARIIMERMRGLAHDLCLSTLDAYLASVMAVSIGRKELPRC